MPPPFFFKQVCVYWLGTGKSVRFSSRIRGVRLSVVLRAPVFAVESADNHCLFAHGHVGECGLGLVFFYALGAEDVC